MRYVFPALAATVAVGLALSGCSTFGLGRKQTKLVCPASYIAPDTEMMAVFKAGGSTMNDVRYGVRISNLQSKCDRADKGIRINTQLAFHIVSNDRSLRAEAFEYFVSIVDGYHNILTKETYSVPFEFDARMHELNKQDEVYVNLPLLDNSTANHYAVVVGLQLTEAQLQFNRAAAGRSPASRVPPAASIAVPAQPRNPATP